MQTSKPALLRGRNGKRLRALRVAGAHNGAAGNLAVKAAVNRASTVVGIHTTYYDPTFGWAAALASRANQAGIEAAGVEASLEAAGLASLTPGDVVIYHTHSAGLVARGLRATLDAGIYSMIYLIIQFPSSDVYAVAATLRPTDRAAHILAALLMAEFDASATPGQFAIHAGRHAITQSIERVLRGRFAAHHERGLMPLVVGAPLGVHAFEVSINASPMQPMVVTESRLGAGVPQRLVEAAAAEHPEVLERGQGYVHAELIPEGIHFHETFVQPGSAGLQVVNTRVVRRVDRTGRLAIKD